MCFFPMWKLGYTPKKENAEVFYLREEKKIIKTIVMLVHIRPILLAIRVKFRKEYFMKMKLHGVFHEDETSWSNP